MLHKKAEPLANILRSMFGIILQVWLSLRSQPPDVPIPATVRQVPFISFIAVSLTNNHHQTLRNDRKKFQQRAQFLYQLLSKLSANGYQPHLQQLLLLINFNEYYSVN